MWESEASHKIDLSQWNSIDADKYKVQVNNGPIFDGEVVAKMGNYNGIMSGCPAYQKCM